MLALFVILAAAAGLAFLIGWAIRHQPAPTEPRLVMQRTHDGAEVVVHRAARRVIIEKYCAATGRPPSWKAAKKWIARETRGLA